MNKIEFLAMLDEIFEVEQGTVKGVESLEDFAWDSLAMITFISDVDSKLEAEISPSKLADAKTVADLIEMVEQHLK